MREDFKVFVVRYRQDGRTVMFKNQKFKLGNRDIPSEPFEFRHPGPTEDQDLIFHLSVKKASYKLLINGINFNMLPEAGAIETFDGILKINS